jgi:hypothetical protein
MKFSDKHDAVSTSRGKVEAAGARSQPEPTITGVIGNW